MKGHFHSPGLFYSVSSRYSRCAICKRLITRDFEGRGWRALSDQEITDLVDERIFEPDE